MKKNVPYHSKNLFVLMQYTSLIVLQIAFGFFLLQAKSVEGQALSKVQINAEYRQTTLKTVYRNIEKETGLHFVYNNRQLDIQQKVDFISQGSLLEALDMLGKKTNTAYKQIGKNIVVVPLSAQQLGILVGKVTDIEGNLLPGATVKIIELNRSASTDVNGMYRLQLPEGTYTIQATYISYGAQVKRDIVISSGTTQTLNFLLDAASSELNEVVVVGFGTQKRVNVTGSVATISQESMKNRPLTNASQALQGVSGAYINQPGGQPGKDGVNVLIRGQGTLNNNSPLVLVDGIEYTLSAVNPKDIESISVLKDAASASIYGNRAANGVILVTTKKGAEGKGKIEYSNYFGTQSTTYLPDVVTDPIEFMQLRNQAQRNAGKATVDYSDELIEEYRQGMLTDPYVYPTNNWLDIMFNNASVQDHNLRFSGGNNASNYAISLGYQDQNGVLMGTGSDRVSFKANVNFKVKEWMNIGADVSGWYRKIDEPASGIGTLMEMTFKAQAFHPTYLEDGRYANTWVVTPGHNVYRHPLVLANEGFNKNKNLRTLVNLYSDITLPAGFSYHVKVGLNKFDGFVKQFVPSITYYNTKTMAASTVDFYTSNRNRHVTDTDNEELNLTVYHTLNWDSDFSDSHHIKALLGNSFEQFTSRNFDATIEGFLGNNLYEINAGSTNPSVNGSSSKNALIGIFGRINYDYKQKYLLEANLRYDGSSRFAKGNQWGLFPSVSAGWRIDQESFMDNLPVFSELKLRASYGSLGNQNISNFRYVNLINSGYEYSLGGAVNAGAAVTAYNDPSITWETTTIANAGIDGGLFHNRLNFTFEYYKKRTSDILREVNLPAQVGALTGPVQNIGIVDNKGWELTLGHRNRVGEFSYSLEASINYNQNKVVELNGQDIYNGKYITREGYPINSYYILEATGIFQNQEEIDNSPFQNVTTKPGYLKYRDQNGDGVVNQDDRIVFRSALPDYTYSFNLSASYKNFTLSGFFQGVNGVYSYPERIIAVPFWFGTSVTKEWVENSWTPERPDAKLPILTTFEDTQEDIFQYSTFWLQNTSYLRLKNVQLAYNFPKKILDKIKLQQLTLFVNGQNLLTFSSMKDFDPERQIQQADYYQYPSVKTYTAGINLTF